jgi:hypothetical protein
VETASDGCQLTELAERWVEDFRFCTSSMMLMVLPATCGELVHWCMGLKKNNFHFSVEEEEKRARKNQDRPGVDADSSPIDSLLVAGVT